MGQVTKTKLHDQDSLVFDAVGVITESFAPTSTMTIGTPATGQPGIIFPLPCSMKIWGIAVTANTTSTVTAWDLRLNQITSVLVPAASATQVNGESDLTGFQTYPPANGTVVVSSSPGLPTSVTYQPLAVSGNGLANLAAGFTGTLTNTTITNATAWPDLIWPKGGALFFTYTCGTIPANTVLAVSIFYKSYDQRPGDRPGTSLASDAVLSYTNDVL